MWEPLKDIVGHHADDFKSLLTGVLNRLDQIAQNTVSAVEFNEYLMKSGRETSNAEGVATVEFMPHEGYSYRVERQCLTGAEAGSCAVYLDAVLPENLVDVVSGTGITAGRPKYFVPRGRRLIFHFYEQGASQICTVAIQLEQLVPNVDPRQPAIGKSNEGAISIERNPDEVPSGNPLYEAQIAH